MKTYFLLISIALIVAGCAPSSPSQPAIMIDDLKISLEEFDGAFAASIYAQRGEEGRSDFLDIFIARKLMLKEAEREHLDKDPKFLRDIQLFWEQSLLKRLLNKKISEAAFNPSITEKEIQDYYAARKGTDFVDTDLTPVLQAQIQYLLAREKQQKMIREWTDQLGAKSAITVDRQLLGIPQK